MSEVEFYHELLVKYLRPNIGGEYYDANYFEFTRIKHEVTAPYTTQ